MTELYRSKYFVWTGDREKINGPIELFYGFLDEAYERLRVKFGFNIDSKLPIPVTVSPSSSCAGGISGWASPAGLGFCAGNWDENHWCYGLVAQELVNYYTGEGVSGGWPSWWATLRPFSVRLPRRQTVQVFNQSPFPILISVELMRDLGKQKRAQEHDAYFSSDVWYCYFRKLHWAKGFNLWRALLNDLRELQVDLGSLNEPTKTALIKSEIAFFMDVLQ